MVWIISLVISFFQELVHELGNWGLFAEEFTGFLLELEPEQFELQLSACDNFPEVMNLLPFFWVSIVEVIPVTFGDGLGNLLGLRLDGCLLGFGGADLFNIFGTGKFRGRRGPLV